MTRNVLVTGGAGFIGSHIVDALLVRGDSVRVIDDESSGKKQNLKHTIDKIEYINGSITDRDLLKRVMNGVDIVFHLAAIGSVPRSVDAPEPSHDANITGTLNVLWAAKQAGAKRVVHSSSSSVYGNNPTLPKREEDLGTVLSPYALQKKAAEEYTLLFYRLYGLETVVLRYFNVYGPRQDPNSQYAALIPKFIAAMKAGKQPTINGDGSASRSFTYVSDVVDANLAAAESESAVGEAMNIGGAVRTTVNEFVTALNTVLGTAITPIYGPVRAGDIPHSMADLSKASKLIGYQPKISFEEGLKKTVASFT
ncbi:SDR family oxidoreductase [bacterium]|nr:SDR family oxidoreductase [bacterium]